MEGEVSREGKVRYKYDNKVIPFTSFLSLSLSVFLGRSGFENAPGLEESSPVWGLACLRL